MKITFFIILFYSLSLGGEGKGEGVEYIPYDILQLAAGRFISHYISTIFRSICQ